MKFDNKDRLLIHNKKTHSGKGERKKAWDVATLTVGTGIQSVDALQTIHTSTNYHCAGKK